MPTPNLTRFTVVRTVWPEPAATLCADVVFRAQVTRGVAVQADLPGQVIEVLLGPVEARIENGVLVHKSTPGVRLVSAAEIAIDGGFNYRVEFTSATLNERPIQLKPLLFAALDHDGIFDLADAAPVGTDDPLASPPIARGPQGWSVDGVRITDHNELVFHREDGTELDDPVPIPAATWSGLDKPPFVAAGDDAAEVLDQLGASASGAVVFTGSAADGRHALGVDAGLSANTASAAAFSRIRKLFTPPLDSGLYLSRSGSSYSFIAGLGSGRYGVFLLEYGAYSLNSVVYSCNSLRGWSVQVPMLSQDDGLGTYAGSGTWTVQPATDPAVGYLRKDITVTTTSGSTTVTASSGAVASTDVGRRIVITGAGTAGADLTTTIQSYTNSTTFAVGTNASASGSRSATVYPCYRYNATAGATATWVSPANATALGLGIIRSYNGGLGKVTITGSNVGAVTPTLLKTAQQVVDSGAYPNTILVANGGTLSPTDRVIDYCTGTLEVFFDQKLTLAEGLTADTYTVVITGTGYTQPTGTTSPGLASRIMVDRWAYSLASTTPATSGANMFTALDLSPTFPSAWEMAMEAKPHSGSTWTWIGQHAHQLEDQQSLTIKINDAAATPADGSITACRSAEITRTTKLYHPESGAALASNPLGTAEYVYRWTAGQLELSVDIAFAVETDVRTAYAMMPLLGKAGLPAKMDRGALEACPDLLTFTGAGGYSGYSRSSFAYTWDSTGNLAAGMYVPDYYGFTNGFSADVDGSRIEDRAAVPLTKIYAPWVGVNHTRTYQPGGRQRYTVRYFGQYFTNANTSLTTDTAAAAGKLATARAVRTDLASTLTADFDGSVDIVPGITGTLPVAHGGTGATTLTGLVKGSGASAFAAAISGTDYADPLIDTQFDLAVGENTMRRREINSSTLAPGNGNLRLTFFKARRTESIGHIRTQVSVAAVGATLARVGLWTVNVSNGDITLVAASDNNTGLWASTTGAHTAALSAAYVKTRDVWYGFGILVVGTSTGPQFYGNAFVPAAEAGSITAPLRLSGIVGSQTDLGAIGSTISAGSITDTGHQYYAALIP